MDRDYQISAMKPGRELDALVAEKVMGWEIWNGQWSDKQTKELTGYDVGRFSFNPSSNISAAWEVVEKVAVIPFSISKIYTRYGGHGWSVNWCLEGYDCDNCDNDCHKECEINAKTAPEAICKAALLAVMACTPTQE